MQNYYIRIEDMPSLVSHQLSIIKYVVLKKIFFFLCFDRLIWTWTWTWTRTSLDSVLTWTRTYLDSVLTWTRTSLDSDLTWTRTSLDLDLSWTRQGGLDYSPNTHTHTWSSGHTHRHTWSSGHTHTHTWSSGNTHTHTRTWSSGAVNAAAAGGQLGVRCLAQGSHFSRGQFLPEPRTHNLRLQVQCSIH